MLGICRIGYFLIGKLEFFLVGRFQEVLKHFPEMISNGRFLFALAKLHQSVSSQSKKTIINYHYFSYLPGLLALKESW